MQTKIKELKAQKESRDSADTTAKESADKLTKDLKDLENNKTARRWDFMDSVISQCGAEDINTLQRCLTPAIQKQILVCVGSNWKKLAEEVLCAKQWGKLKEENQLTPFSRIDTLELSLSVLPN